MKILNIYTTFIKKVMETAQLELLKYPIGRYLRPEIITDDMMVQWIGQMTTLPFRLRKLVIQMNDEQLDTPYRPDGWTVRQVMHHIPDSHINGYIRFKWALTEENPVIKAYDEKGWAEIFDAKSAPVEMSLQLLDAVHTRWVYLIRGLSGEELERTFVHPETNTTAPLKATIGLYAWHGEHHYMHINNLIKRNNW